MNKENIDIFEINGILKTNLSLKGWVYEKKYVLGVYLGTKKICTLVPNEYREDINFLNDEKNTDINYGFDYIIKVPLNSRRINVYVETERGLRLIKSCPNNILYRFAYPIYSFIRKRLSKLFTLCKLILKTIKFLWKEHKLLVPMNKMLSYIKIFLGKFSNELYRFKRFNNPYSETDYHKWIHKYEKETPITELSYNPLISVVMPVYNVDEVYLKECIESVLNQTYQNFELCIADDCSTSIETIKCLKKYEENPKVKIEYRKKNGHISEATNTAISIAKGEFIGLLDNDDVLRKNALYEIAKKLNEDRNIDMIYSDEDKLSVDGKRIQPVFKPDWSPDTLMSHNYICHFTVIRKKIIDKIGGFRKGVEGSQDFDLFLRVTEETNRIEHLPMILYHWRMIPSSTSMDIGAKTYVIDRGATVLEDTLKRRKFKGKVIKHDKSTFYTVEYDAPKNSSTVVFINYRTNEKNLDKCLMQLKEFANINEIVVLNYKTNSIEKICKKYAELNIKIVDCVINSFSQVVNNELKITNAKYVTFIDDNCYMKTKEWLPKMIGHASQRHIGAVGIKITLNKAEVLHGGMILGIRNSIAYNSRIGKSVLDHGVMFRLIVPTNFSCVSGACLVIEKEKMGELNHLINLKYWNINLCLELLERGYYNVLLPGVTGNKKRLEHRFQNGDQLIAIQKEKEYMLKRWEKYIKNDKFYNINFDEQNEFMLRK